MTIDSKPKIHLVQVRPSEPSRDKKSFDLREQKKALELVRSAASTGTLLFLALTFLTLLFSLLPRSVFSATLLQEQRLVTRVSERKRISESHPSYKPASSRPDGIAE